MDQSKCQHPKKLRGKPAECTPEQIKECHGDSMNHSCEGKKKGTPSKEIKRKRKA
jgi:hypothetical protein